LGDLEGKQREQSILLNKILNNSENIFIKNKITINEI